MSPDFRAQPLLGLHGIPREKVVVRSNWKFQSKRRARNAMQSLQFHVIFSSLST
jgi:hypothetical protein